MMQLRFRDVRPDDAAALAHVLVSANEAAFRGIVPDACLAMTESQSAANWTKTLTRGLPAGDFLEVVESLDGASPDVIGYAWGGPRPDDPTYGGELRQIQLLPSQQRRGIGRILVTRVVKRLAAEQRIHSLRVEVLECNPNRAFYERLGAKHISTRTYDWNGTPLPMFLYGWPNTRELLNA